MKSVFKELASKGLIYGLGSSLNGLVSFILIPFFVTRLRADEYGRFALAEMLLNLLLVILGMGLNVALLARYPKSEPHERQELLSSLFSWTLLSTLLIGLIFLTLTSFFGRFIWPDLDIEMYLLIIAVSAIEVVWSLFATLYRAEGAACRYISTSLVQVVAGLSATIILIVYMGFRDKGILYGRLLGDVVLLFCLVPQFIKYPPRLNLKPILPLLKIGLPLIPATLASMWIMMSPRFFIESFGSTADVGVFAMSSKIAAVMLLIFVQPFSMAWMVALFKIYHRTDAEKIYGRVFTYYLLLGILLALSLSIAAPGIVTLLSRKNFPLSIDTITVVALAYVASGSMYPITIGPYVREKTQMVVPVFVSSSILSIILGWGMTAMWGIMGASLALLVTYTTQAVFLRRLSVTLYPMPFEWVRIAKGVSSLVIAFFSVRYIGHSDCLLELLCLPVIFMILSSALLLLFKFPDEGEIATLMNIFRIRKKTKLEF